ncbi:MAG: hypothetical protein H6923_03020 [Alphaproteobacteria bacterium]|nr:hypothetical protein [Alphaproteobacteria bacterium]
MTSEPNDVVVAVLKAKLAEILSRKARNERVMSRLVEDDLAIHRELADLRAGARVLGVSLAFPEQKDEERRIFRIRVGSEREGKNVTSDFASRFVHFSGGGGSGGTEKALAGAQHNPPVKAKLPVPPTRPPIKEIVLDRLKEAGDNGAEAAKIRAHIERVYADKLHEKTVGMTLYRLAKDGLVRRDGRTWYLAKPQGAETRTPGVVAPGIKDRET